MAATIGSPLSNAKLRALLAEVSPKEYPLVGELCRLGRQNDCHVVVTDPQVSRVHARIERRNTQYVLIDAGSANGTYVNGVRLVDEHVLRHQDAIGLASKAAQLQFIDEDITDIRPRKLQFLRHEQRFMFNGAPLDLSRNLRRLLLHLHAHIGRVCTHASCIEAIWPGEQHDADHVALLHREVSELRKKFRAIDPDTEVIKLRHGVGYYLEPDL